MIPGFGSYGCLVYESYYLNDDEVFFYTHNSRKGVINI